MFQLLPIKQYFIEYIVKVKILVTQAANKLRKSKKYCM
jgi:hypothetical protein